MPCIPVLLKMPEKSDGLLLIDKPNCGRYSPAEQVLGYVVSRGTGPLSGTQATTWSGWKVRITYAIVSGLFLVGKDLSSMDLFRANGSYFRSGSLCLGIS